MASLSARALGPSRLSFDQQESTRQINTHVLSCTAPLSPDQQTDKRISSFTPIITFADLEYQKASFYRFTGEERSALFLSP